MATSEIIIINADVPKPQQQERHFEGHVLKLGLHKAIKHRCRSCQAPISKSFNFPIYIREAEKKLRRHKRLKLLARGTIIIGLVNIVESLNKHFPIKVDYKSGTAVNEKDQKQVSEMEAEITLIQKANP